MGLKRLCDRFLTFKLVLEEDQMHPNWDQMIVLKEFWEDMDGLIREIPTSEKIFVGDLNGHVGQEWIIEGMRECIEDRDLEKGMSQETILEFSLAFY